MYRLIQIWGIFTSEQTGTPISVSQPVRQYSGKCKRNRNTVQNTRPIQSFSHVLSDTVTVFGAENIPSAGPLLVVCNHPGAFDSAVMSATLPRKDLKVLVSGVPFLYNLPNLAPYLIYAPGDTYDRMKALRLMMRHLKKGGAILSFASGKVDPDPQVLPGAKEALGEWSPSLEIILRRVPETKLLPAIISGVLSKTAIRVPIIRIQKESWKQRRLAEYFQIAGQILFPKQFLFKPSVSFGHPMMLSEIESIKTTIAGYGDDGSTSRVMMTIRNNAIQLLDQHNKNINNIDLE